MAKNLSTLYPGKIDIDGNNPNGTFKNRTSDVLKDGTPYEKGWASDIWGFVSHILKIASVTPDGSEENETNSQYYDALEGSVGRREVTSESKELVLDLIGVTTVDVDAVRLSLLDSAFIPKFLDDLDITFVIPTDLMAGTSEKASTWYQIWVDSELVKRLVPDLTGTADGTAAGFLVDTANTFATDLVTIGDVVRNRTDGTETTVAVTPTVDGNDLNVTDDIFVSGEDYQIKILSPEGLGDNKALIGQVFNDSSSDFTKLEKYGRARITTAFWHTDNDFGSTNTNIPKFLTEVESSDDVVVTIDNSATLGFSITANMNCCVDISLSLGFTAAIFWGISKNSTELTTSYASMSVIADRMSGVTSVASGTSNVKVSLILKKGSVFRPHAEGTFQAFPDRSTIQIKATEIT